MSGGGNGGYDPAALGGQLGNKLQEAMNGPAFAEPTYATTTGLNDLAKTRLNPSFVSGAQGAVDSFGDIAAGKRFGMNDPGYATLRQKVADDVTTQTNSAFNNSGLFGSDDNKSALAEGLGNALAGLDYGNFQNDQQRQMAAVPLLGQSFGLTQAPAQTLLGVGSAFDTINQNRIDAPFNRLVQGLGAFNGSSQSPGMSEPVPLWQQLLGYVAGNAGQAARFLG